VAIFCSLFFSFLKVVFMKCLVARIYEGAELEIPMYMSIRGRKISLSVDVGC